MNFSPTMKTYHLPESGGSYISRDRSISSHTKQTLLLEGTVEYYSIHLTTIILDFIAYLSHIISKLCHLDGLIDSTEQARRRFKREFKLCASTHKQFNQTVVIVEIIDKVYIMPNRKHIADSSIPSILDDNIKTPSTFATNKDYKRYFTLKHKKYNVEAGK